MKNLRVARRYARALFELSLEQNRLSAVLKDLSGLKALIDQVPDFRIFLKNPIVRKSDQERLMTSLFKGRADDLVMRFILFLIDKSRLNVLDEILECMEELKLDMDDAVRVRVVSERSLPESLARQILSRIRERLGKKIIADYAVDDCLVGGFKIYIKDQVYDASLKSQLNRFHQDILSNV